MNIIDKVKLAFKSYGFITTEIKEAQLPTASGSPGWKTSEFWLKLGQTAGVLWLSVRGLIPAKLAIIVEISGYAIYAIGRVVAKAVSDIQAAKAVSTTVTTTAPVTTVTTP